MRLVVTVITFVAWARPGPGMVVGPRVRPLPAARPGRRLRGGVRDSRRRRADRPVSPGALRDARTDCRPGSTARWKSAGARAPAAASTRSSSSVFIIADAPQPHPGRRHERRRGTDARRRRAARARRLRDAAPACSSGESSRRDGSRRASERAISSCSKDQDRGRRASCRSRIANPFVWCHKSIVAVGMTQRPRIPGHDSAITSSYWPSTLGKTARSRSGRHSAKSGTPLANV